MSETTQQFETDQLLRLLTDALRAGPGSPQWHEAVARLRTENSPEVDEYRLLVRAREDLESGRDYRGLRAGPGFTRKVMQRIEDEASGAAAPRIPSAMLVAVLAAAGILSVVIAIAVVLVRSTPPLPTAQDLVATTFATTVSSTDFKGGLPVEWRSFGLEPVAAEGDGGGGGGGGGGLRAGASKDGEKEYLGGGVVASMPYRSAEPFAVEASVRMAKPTGQVVLRLFVTENPTFDTAKATSAGEFVAELNNGQVSVFKPDGTLVGEAAKVEAGEALIHLLIKMDRQFAVVEVDGRQVYAGAHALGTDGSRWPGLRFLSRGSERGLDNVVVQSVRVLRP